MTGFKGANEDLELVPDPPPISDAARLRAYLVAAVDAIDGSEPELVTPDRVNVPTGPDMNLEGVVFDPVQDWNVYVPLKTNSGRFIYVHTPSCMFRSDVVALTPKDARRLGAALMVSADWAESDMWRRRDPESWLPK